MKNILNFRLIGILAILILALVGCGNTEDASADNDTSTDKAADEEASENETQTITYLGEDYIVPKVVDDIATASLESMEDAAILGIKPMASITVGGELPEYLADELAGAEDIGDKQQPSHETLLELKPDVIMGSSKFQPEVAENLEKVAPMFPVSHISTDWEENLNLMAKLTGKEAKAEEIITTYKDDVATIKEEIASNVENKKIVIVRIRTGNIFVYSADTYFNPVLYQDLGIAIPDEIEAVKAQEMITLENLAKLNPDYLFVQFDESENADNPKALEDLQSNPIFQSIQAAKDELVFVNSVDPMAQGGTAWSKTTFLETVKELLVK